ncbi:MAG: ribbon-helix-helix domain-containing protein [Lewinellaceae bacterium]|nr:ribbon-helix-helix domain-containing protein [Lewinellaceae bacterium]
MANYISSLPDSVLSKLNEVAQTLRVPKNKIIERALIKYLTEVERQLYIRSFRQLAGDEDMLKLVEEGMDEYWRVLEDWDAKG